MDLDARLRNLTHLVSCNVVSESSSLLSLVHGALHSHGQELSVNVNSVNHVQIGIYARKQGTLAFELLYSCCGHAVVYIAQVQNVLVKVSGSYTKGCELYAQGG